MASPSPSSAPVVGPAGLGADRVLLVLVVLVLLRLTGLRDLLLRKVSSMPCYNLLSCFKVEIEDCLSVRCELELEQ